MNSRRAGGFQTVSILARAGFLAALRPDKYARMGFAVRREGATPLAGLALAAARRPDAPAVIDELGSITWRELDASSNALAVAFQRLADDGPVGILARNHRGLVQALASTTRAGRDALLLNTGFSAAQLADVLVREGARTLVYDDEFATLVETARERVAGLVEIVAWGSGDTTVAGLVSLCAGETPVRVERPGRVILLTSGTTGTPKGARGPSGGGLSSVAAIWERIPWRAEERVVVAAPIFHAFGFGQLAIAMTLCCTVVMRRRFDPEATMALVDEHEATGLAVVPVMLERIADLPASTLDRMSGRSLRFVTASGSRMRSDALLSFMDRFGDVVYNSYNATEAGLISTATPADLRLAPTTAGRPVLGTEVRILGEDRSVLPAETVGSIAVASGSTFDGYTTGGTKEFHGSLMLSGDVGYFDREGRLFVVGRDDDMIVSGGENVFPSEVERALASHPAVRECAVVGVEDEAYGQRLAAFVVAHHEVSADALKAHVKETLAGYKVPRDVTFLDELPRNASGKVLTRELEGVDARRG